PTCLGEVGTERFAPGCPLQPFPVVDDSPAQAPLRRIRMEPARPTVLLRLFLDPLEAAERFRLPEALVEADVLVFGLVRRPRFEVRVPAEGVVAAEPRRHDQ